MKKALFITALSIACSQAFAVDSTKVTTHQKVTIKTDPSKGFTEYPAWGIFPKTGKSYRKVYLYLEFGCAPGLNCGEWDYINTILIGRKGGLGPNSVKLNYEIARFITPYGNYWKSSQNWKHGWYFDVTDFSVLLHDSVEIIYQHTGYEANNDRGWTVTMDFICVEGEAARIPVGITRLFQGGVTYGNSGNPFKNQVPDQQITMPGGANRANFKIIQTGHGFNTTENCAEFCSKKRTVKLDDDTISEKNVWRDDCGMNSLFPQAGTWLYDRAGWCPGAPVIPDNIYVSLPENTQHNFSLDMEAYTNMTGNANYSLTTYAQYFKDNTKKYDAAIDDILAPSTHLDYLRMNPTCAEPILRIKNMGSETLTAIEFEYGKLGGVLQKIWVPCNIKPFETQVVHLESVYNWAGPGNTFVATITKVNDRPDEYTADNTMYSKITNSVSYPNKIFIVFKSNNAPSENYYTLKDSRGKVVSSKNNFAANTIYRDTINLENNLCYTFEFFDDGPPPGSNPLNKDGLDFWANTGDGAGYLQIRNGNTNLILKNFGADFGTKQLLNFYTTFNMETKALQDHDAFISIDVMPNPAIGNTWLYLDFIEKGDYALQVFDLSGKLVFSKQGNSLYETIPLENLMPGMYTISVIQGTHTAVKKFVVE
jgi:hypothetical protein